jgi:hypothetical protein
MKFAEQGRLEAVGCFRAKQEGIHRIHFPVFPEGIPRFGGFSGWFQN